MKSGGEHRKKIETIPDKLYKNNYIFKVGVDYGFFSPENCSVMFYYELMEAKKRIMKHREKDNNERE